MGNARNKSLNKPLVSDETVEFKAFAFPRTQDSNSQLSEQVEPQNLNGRTASYAIAFYLPNLNTPIVVQNTHEFIIGRYDVSSGFVLGVDLAPYDAQKLGVSRQHAKIVYEDSFFYIQDLRSKNGTWLNYVKLEPQRLAVLSIGDIIQLGYFSMRVG